MDTSPRRRTGLVALLLLLAAFFPLPAHAQDVQENLPERTIAAAFLGEVLDYEIGFWLFDSVAVGTLTIEKGENDGEFVSTLAVHTTGVVDRLIASREDRYVSTMTMTPDGKRFVSKTFEKSVNWRGRERRGLTVMDYEKRLMTWRSWGGGKEDREGSAQIPEGIWSDDPIAAFYNLRYGVYGPAEEGREYTIYSFPKEDHVPRIYLRVAGKEEFARRFKDRLGADYLMDAKIDKDVFGSKSGDIEILFTNDLTPVRAVVKDILFFGDVRGRLRRVALPVDFENKASEEGSTLYRELPRRGTANSAPAASARQAP